MKWEKLLIKFQNLFSIKMLKKISENQITGVKLIKPDVTKKYYHIASDTDIYATIDLIHGQGSLARLETPEGSYTIKRQGIFIPYINVRKENDETDIAELFLDICGKSSIQLDGSALSFKPLALWKNHWGWVNEKNRAVMKFMLTISGQERGNIEFSKDFFYFQNLELLAALGGYLLLQLEDELTRLSENK